MPDQKDPLARALQRKAGVMPAEEEPDPLADLELGIAPPQDEEESKAQLLDQLTRKLPPRVRPGDELVQTDKVPDDQPADLPDDEEKV